MDYIEEEEYHIPPRFEQYYHTATIQHVPCEPYATPLCSSYYGETALINNMHTNSAQHGFQSPYTNILTSTSTYYPYASYASYPSSPASTIQSPQMHAFAVNDSFAVNSNVHAAPRRHSHHHANNNAKSRSFQSRDTEYPWHTPPRLYKIRQQQRREKKQRRMAATKQVGAAVMRRAYNNHHSNMSNINILGPLYLRNPNVPPPPRRYPPVPPSPVSPPSPLDLGCCAQRDSVDRERSSSCSKRAETKKRSRSRRARSNKLAEKAAMCELEVAFALDVNLDDIDIDAVVDDVVDNDHDHDQEMEYERVYSNRTEGEVSQNNSIISLTIGELFGDEVVVAPPIVPVNELETGKKMKKRPKKKQKQQAQQQQ